jgi:hypothetical protein
MIMFDCCVYLTEYFLKTSHAGTRLLEMASCRNEQVYYISSEDENDFVNSTGFQSSNAAPSSDCDVDSKSLISKMCKIEPAEAQTSGDQLIQQNVITTTFCNKKLMHKCNICYFQNDNHDEVVRHFRSKHANVPSNQSSNDEAGDRTADVFKCGDCPFQTLYQSSFERHRSHHLTAYPLRCSHCSFSSTTVTGLRRHGRIAHKDRSKWPSSISLSVDFEPSRWLHSESYSSRAEILQRRDVFSCRHCRKSYGSRCQLTRHVRRVHPISTSLHKCTRCGIACASQLALTNHTSTKHTDESSEDRPSSDGVISHRNAISSRSQKTSCSESFALRIPSDSAPTDNPVNVAAAGTDEVHASSARQTHRGRRRHWTSATKSQRCGRCLFNTRYPQVLQRHIQSVHNNIRPFQCTLCGHRTNDKHDMRKHLRSVHQSLHAVEYTKLSVEQAVRTTKDHMCVTSKSSDSKLSVTEDGKTPVTPELKEEDGIIDKQTVDTNSGTYAADRVPAPGTHVIDDVGTNNSSLDSNNNQTTTGNKVLTADRGTHSDTNENYLNVVGNEAVQRLECAVCPMTFSTAVALCQHVITHKDLRRYRCSTCGWRSNRKENMQDHVNKIHVNGTSFDRLSVAEAMETIKSYKKQFPPLRNTNTYLQQKGPQFTVVKQIGSDRGINTSSNCSASEEFDSVFICSVCSLRFAKEESLRRHVVVSHADVRRFQCLLCGLRTNFEPRIKNHVTNVHGMVVADLFYRQLSMEEATDTIDLYRLNFPWHVDTSARILNSDESVDNQNEILTRRCAGSARVTLSDAVLRIHSSLTAVTAPAEQMDSNEQLFANDTLRADSATVETQGCKNGVVYWSRNLSSSLRKCGQNQLLLKCALCNFRTRWHIVLRRHQNIFHQSVQEAVDCQPLNHLPEEVQCNDMATAIPSLQNQSVASSKDRQLCESESPSISSEIQKVDPDEAGSSLTIGMIHPLANFETEDRPVFKVDRLKLRRFMCTFCGYRSNVRSHVTSHQVRIHSGEGALSVLPEDEARKTLEQYEKTRVARGRPSRFILSGIAPDTPGNISAGPDLGGRKTMSIDSIDNDVNLFAGKNNDKRSWSGRFNHVRRTWRPEYRQQRKDALANLRRFKCSKCAYRTNWACNFYRHRKTRHANTDTHVIRLSVDEARATDDVGVNNVRSYTVSCSYCSYRAFSFLDLKRHSRLTHHSNVNMKRKRVRNYGGGQSLPTNVSRFKCSQCNFRSKWSGSLYNHRRRYHTNARATPVPATEPKSRSRAVVPPFKCSSCSFRSRWTASIYNHRRRFHRREHVVPMNTTQAMTTSRSADAATFSEKGFSRRRRRVQPPISRSRNDSGVPSAPRLFHCWQCDFGTKWIHSLMRHVVNRHPTTRSVTENNIQDLCSGSSSPVSAVVARDKVQTASNLNVKKSSCVKMQDGSFACQYCSKRSFYRHAIMLHQISKHPETLAGRTVNNDDTNVGKGHEMTAELPLKISSVECSVGVTSVACSPQSISARSCLSPECRSDDMIPSIARDLENDGSPTAKFHTEESDASRSRVITHSTTRRAAFRNTWLMCKQCPFLTKLSYSLLAHKQLHRSRASATVRCSLCSYSCGSRDKLAKHSEVHERNYVERRTLKQWCSVPAKTQFPAGAFFSSSVLACGLCPFLTKHSFGLSRHKELHRPRPASAFRCSICSFRSCEQRTSVEHGQVHEFMYLKKRLNTLCHFTTAQATSSSRRNLGDRVSHSESSGEVAMSSVGEMTVRKELKTWRCGRCPYVVEDVEHFRRHVSMHGRRRPHECVECNFSTFSYWQSAEHRRLHITGVHSQSLVNLTQRSQVLADDEQPCVTKDDSYVEGQSRTTKIEAWRCDRDCYDERCALSDDEAMRRMDCREEAKRLLRHERGISREECKCCRCCVTYEPQQTTISQVKAEDDDDSSGSRSNMKSVISDERGVEKGQYDCVLTCSSLESETTLQCDKSSVQTESETVSYNCQHAKSTIDPAEEALNSDESLTNERVCEVHVKSSDWICVYCGRSFSSRCVLDEHESSHLTENSS